MGILCFYVFFPRLGRLKVLTTLTNQIHILQTLPHDALDSLHKATAIRVFTFIEAKRLFVEIPKQMKRLAINVGAFDGAFEQAPEVFQSVRMNVTLGVANRVVNDLVNVILVHADVRAKRIRMKLCALQNILTHITLDFMITSSLKHLQFDPRCLTASRALKETLNGGLALPARNNVLLALMSETVTTADKGFVGFNATTHFVKRAFLKRKANAVKHEPSCLLRDAERATNLVRANAILGVDDQPDGGKPLAQGQRAIAKDGSDLNRKLLLALFAVAHHPLAGKLADIGRAAMRTLRLSVRPKNIAHKVVRGLRISEKRDGFLKCFGKGFLFHATISHRGY